MEAQFLAEQVIITIHDNGIGFQVPQETADLVNVGSLGLMGLRERAQLFGGHMDIQSNLGEGTTIRVTLPRTPQLAQFNPEQQI